MNLCFKVTGKSWIMLVTFWTKPHKYTCVKTLYEQSSGKETGIGSLTKCLHIAVSVGFRTRSSGLIIGRSKVRVLPGPPFISFEFIRLRKFHPWTHGLLVGGSVIWPFWNHGWYPLKSITYEILMVGPLTNSRGIQDTDTPFITPLGAANSLQNQVFLILLSCT